MSAERDRREPCWNCGGMTTFTVDEDGTPRDVKSVEADQVIDWLREALHQDDEWADIARSLVSIKRQLIALEASDA